MSDADVISAKLIERRAEAEKQSESCGCLNTRQKIIQLRICEFFAEFSALTQSPLPLISALSTTSGQNSSTTDVMTPLLLNAVEMSPENVIC